MGDGDVRDDGPPIRNPILPGFNPDPSIVRVGEDYFVATSTFEWYPGVQIHHSRNLVDWTLLTRPLRRASQLDLRGNPDSCGVWAPCLSHADGLFWLVYTNVRRYDGAFKDAHNYLVTARDVRGDWSDPVHLNSSGFDPSLFHDEDGRKWLLNLAWNHRATRIGQSPFDSPFGGILLQEYDPVARRLVGVPRRIFDGSSRGLAEGPHLFRRDGWYYLVVAEGGTGYEHAVTHARSRAIEGPYELHPDVHPIVADPARGGTLQRAGHGQTVETSAGEWYHVHLCSRPLAIDERPETPVRRRSPLGRESAIQRCEWGADGWLRLAHGSSEPRVEVPAPSSATSAREGGASASDADRDGVRAAGDDAVRATDGGAAHAGASPSPIDDRPRRYRFGEGPLPLDFQWPRTPEWRRLFSLDARPGHLRLHGRESIGSFFEQALVARRQQHLAYEARTRVEFEPSSFQQGAGLVAWYDRDRFHFLHLTHDERQGRVLLIASGRGDWPRVSLAWPLPVPIAVPDGPIELRCRVERETLRFAWQAADGSDAVGDDGLGSGARTGADRAAAAAWREVGPALDASLLSDEAGRGEHASFTGAFVGMLVFDVSGGALPADFAFFDYEPL